VKRKNAIVNVHTLGEFSYRPLAGLLAYKQQGQSEYDEPVRIPNLGFEPIFEHALLIEERNRLKHALAINFSALFVVMLTLVLIAKFISPMLGVSLSLGTFPLVVSLVRGVQSLVNILAQLESYEHCLPQAIDFSNEKIQPITWWGLVKSGFRTTVRREPLEDRESALVGRPNRVLEDNGIRHLPVIVHRHSAMTELKVSQSHLVKLAAYSHLLQRNEGAKADWGIVIDSETLSGFAIPISDQQVEEMDRQLVELHSLMGSGGSVAKPPEWKCRKCHRGKPRRYVPGVTETIVHGLQLIPRLSLNSTGEEVHSDCGDENKWRPPHEYWSV